MNILGRVTWKAMLQNKTRTIVTIVGIILSAAMFSAVTTMGMSLRDFMIRGYIYEQGDYFVQFDYAREEDLAGLQQEDGIAHIADYQVLGFLKTQEDSDGPMSTFVLAAGDETFYKAMPVHLVEGRLPENSSEIVLPEVILRILNYHGMGTQVGETITMDLITMFYDYPFEDSPTDIDRKFTKTYTIVGLTDDETYNRVDDFQYYSMLTYADGDQGEPIWHRFFVKTNSAATAHELYAKEYGISAYLFDSYMYLFGVTQYSNYNLLIIGLCAVLCVIIMVGSVSLIYNAFSISVSERTKQFGLLSSIGATRKQLRQSVLYEGALLGCIGIPIGLLCGYGGIAVTLAILRDRIRDLLSFGSDAVTLEPVFSPLAFAAAAVIGAVTILISAAIPARRATKISPLEAIRQTNDYKATRKAVKVGKLTYKLFGLPGAMAKKYYRISRKKYRTTVISLTISIVLFISASCFSDSLRNLIANAVQYENYDMVCYGDHADLEELRQQPFISQAAYVAQDHHIAYVPDEQLSAEFLDCWDELRKYSNGDKNMQNISVFYLEDATLESYLKKHGISPAPYLDLENPTALVCYKRVSTYYVQNEVGEWVRYTYAYAPFDDDAKQLMLLENTVPDALEPSDGAPGVATWEYITDETGTPVLEVSAISYADEGIGIVSPDGTTTARYQVEFSIDTDGNTVGTYYLIDESGQVGTEPAAVETFDTPHFRLGKTIDELPFGINSSARNDSYYTAVILPLSATVKEYARLFFNVSDYTAAKAYLSQNFEEHNYTDYREDQEHNKTMLLLVNVFSYGFIILISLICAANVFNTVSTNIALRRRDFGMLRSVGLQAKEMYRMMNYECLIYGSRALLFGLSLGLIASLFIHQIDSTVSYVSYAPPWTAMAVACVSVFLVVFATMLYAITRLRKDNPIDAIRMENL